MTSSPPVSGWLTLDQAGQYANLSRRSLERLIASGKLKVFRPTRRRLIDRAELDAVIRATAKVRR